ncbi:MAG: RdgB/HAM1 family non-canonical purine NTP pyrophosphatase [Elusimicrobia bacterium]|nr:RdgB/HAM1 family non-canonical purine NTP pyrophosphatase [Elusimicrobiota bacterium]
MKLILATNNRDKYKEITGIWKDLEGLSLDWLGNHRLDDIEETGATLHDNAAIKAEYAAKKFGCAAVADDTGLFVSSLGGKPGVYSSRYAGENATYDENVSKLLEDMKSVPRRERGAEFRCVTCLSGAGKENIFSEGIVRGYISTRRKGSGGFGYDPVFEVGESGRTFAEMTAEEKNSLSHRHLSFEKMGEIIREIVRRKKL